MGIGTHVYYNCHYNATELANQVEYYGHVSHSHPKP